MRPKLLILTPILIGFFLGGCSISRSRMKPQAQTNPETSYTIGSFVEKTESSQDCNPAEYNCDSDFLARGKVEENINKYGGVFSNAGLTTTRKQLPQVNGEFRDCSDKQSFLGTSWSISSLITFGIIPYWRKTATCTDLTINFPNGKVSKVSLVRRGFSATSILFIGWGPMLASNTEEQVIENLISEIPAVVQKIKN